MELTNHLDYVQIRQLAKLVADEVVKRIEPAKDEMTRRQVTKEFGTGWLDYQVSRNRIRGKRKGPYKNSPIIFSRAEIMALKAAEKLPPSAKFKNAK